MLQRNKIDLGRQEKCKGLNCGKPVIFVDVIIKEKLKRICLDVEPISVYLPIFDKADVGSAGPKKPMRWQKRICYRAHNEVCVNAGDFNPFNQIGGNY